MRRGIRRRWMLAIRRHFHLIGGSLIEGIAHGAHSPFRDVPLHVPPRHANERTYNMEDAITTTLFALPDDTAAYPDHGPAMTIGPERRCNPFVLEYLNHLD